MKINYRPEIDGLRAITYCQSFYIMLKFKFLIHNFLKVVLELIFFVISGYLISSIILKG